MEDYITVLHKKTIRYILTKNENNTHSYHLWTDNTDKWEIREFIRDRKTQRPLRLHTKKEWFHFPEGRQTTVWYKDYHFFYWDYNTCGGYSLIWTNRQTFLEPNASETKYYQKRKLTYDTNDRLIGYEDDKGNIWNEQWVDKCPFMNESLNPQPKINNVIMEVMTLMEFMEERGLKTYSPPPIIAHYL